MKRGPRSVARAAARRRGSAGRRYLRARFNATRLYRLRNSLYVRPENSWYCKQPQHKVIKNKRVRDWSRVSGSRLAARAARDAPALRRAAPVPPLGHTATLCYADP